MIAKEFLESKGTDYTLNYPLSRKKEIETWMDEYATLYHDSKVKKLKSVCDCGKPISSKYSPCCSISCWSDKFE